MTFKQKRGSRPEQRRGMKKTSKVLMTVIPSNVEG